MKVDSRQAVCFRPWERIRLYQLLEDRPVNIHEYQAKELLAKFGVDRKSVV